MAEKTLRARLKLLYKSWSEWQSNLDFVPLQGEACIVYAPANTLESLHEPALLVKIGDGTTDFEHLPYIQAIASDVYDWAKKQSLDWNDLDATFKAALSSFIGDKVDHVIIGANGKALIFNESDGGGAKFEHSDGTWSFVGVNDAGKGGIAAQIYAIDHNNSNKGARINVTTNGIFYTNGRTSGGDYSADDELATKGDIAALGSALHYIGMTEKQAGETDEQALARVVTTYQTAHPGYVLSAGAVAIVDVKEFIFNGTAWQEFGDEGLYETKADAQAAHEALQAAIEAEASARAAADAKKVDKEIVGANGKALVFNESDGGGVQFEHKDGTNSFVGVNDGGGDNGLAAQIYAIDKTTNVGTRINVTENGIYYTKGKSSYTQQTAADEIATKGDIGDLAAIAHTGNVNDLVQTIGDILIIDGNA